MMFGGDTCNLKPWPNIKIKDMKYMGVGRHVLGSHIYDYWHDPYGHVHEHMSDGDKITRSFGQRIHSISGLVKTAIINGDRPLRNRAFAI